MKYLIRIASILIFMTSVNTYAVESCGALFGEGISLSVGLFSTKNQYDDKMTAELTAKVLSMAQSTMGQAMSEKLTLEKNGKILLGQMLKDNWSLEMEYAQDSRLANNVTKDAVFRLAEITIVRPNGERLKLSKSATTMDGKALSKDIFSAQELGLKELAPPFDVLQSVQLPITIEGPLWASLSNWIPHLEYLNRASLREVEPRDLFKLRMKGYFLSKVEDMKKIVNKQSLKFLMLAGVMYLYTERNNINIDFLLPDPWVELVESSKMKSLHADESQDLTQLISGLLQINPAQLGISTSSKSGKYTKKLYLDLNEIIHTARSLAVLEKKNGGKQHLYIFKKSKFTPISVKKITEILNSEAEEPFMLVYHHPTMKRVWLIAGAQSIEGEDDEMKYFTFAIDANSESEMYKLFKNRLAPAERIAE